MRFFPTFIPNLAFAMLDHQLGRTASELSAATDKHPSQFLSTFKVFLLNQCIYARCTTGQLHAMQNPSKHKVFSPPINWILADAHKRDADDMKSTSRHAIRQMKVYLYFTMHQIGMGKTQLEKFISTKPKDRESTLL